MNRFKLLLIAVGIVITTGGCAGAGSSPTSPTATPTPAVAPFTLSKGDTFRIEFRINPAGWAGLPTPDTMSIQLMGSGESDGDTDGCPVEVYDGPRRVGSGKASSCYSIGIVQAGTTTGPGEPRDVLMDFAPILAGTIEGRIDLHVTAKRFTSNALYQIYLMKNTGGGHYRGANDNAVTITSQTIIR
jgi:hypothetical protein